MEASIVRENLMTREGYSPYCGSDECRYGIARSVFNGHQFTCKCGWVSTFPIEFINRYKEKWRK